MKGDEKREKGEEKGGKVRLACVQAQREVTVTLRYSL